MNKDKIAKELLILLSFNQEIIDSIGIKLDLYDDKKSEKEIEKILKENEIFRKVLMLNKQTEEILLSIMNEVDCNLLNDILTFKNK